VSQTQAACPQATTLDGVLKANVDKDGFVDYAGIRTNKGGDLYQYITMIETADLTGCSDSEKLAFWLNAYNAHMIRLILARPAMKNSNENPAMLDEKFKVQKRQMSLNDIKD